MKACPNCGLEVPLSASRCKQCFHDFTEKPQSRSAWGVVALLGMAAIASVASAIALGIISSYPLEQKILVDAETHSVVTTTRYRAGITTDRLRFDDVTKLEYVQKMNAFEIRVVDDKGERHLISRGAEPLEGMAEHYAKVMNKPLDHVDEVGRVPGKDAGKQED